MHDVLVVGEALVDIVMSLDLPVAEHPGGSPANVALGLARLGRHPALLTRIGDDDRGRAVRTHLEASGVRLVPGSVTGERTSTATVNVDEAGVAGYDFNLDWRLPADVVPDFGACLHTGSIATYLAPGSDAVLALVDKAVGRATISYDPNARPLLMGDPEQARLRVASLVARADVVKVSEEDLAWLAPDEDPVDVAAGWLASGPAFVVVTLGREGAVGLCRAGRVEVTVPPIEVVDTVGAGDSFMAGLLDRLAALGLLGAERLSELRGIRTGVLQDMLHHAARIAAITCTRAGANPPSRTELEAWPRSLPSPA
jgi:fructokinase